MRKKMKNFPILLTIATLMHSSLIKTWTFRKPFKSQFEPTDLAENETLSEQKHICVKLATGHLGRIHLDSINYYRGHKRLFLIESGYKYYIDGMHDIKRLKKSHLQSAQHDTYTIMEYDDGIPTMALPLNYYYWYTNELNLSLSDSGSTLSPELASKNGLNGNQQNQRYQQQQQQPSQQQPTPPNRRNMEKLKSIWLLPATTITLLEYLYKPTDLMVLITTKFEYFFSYDGRGDSAHMLEKTYIKHPDYTVAYQRVHDTYKGVLINRDVYDGNRYSYVIHDLEQEIDFHYQLHKFVQNSTKDGISRANKEMIANAVFYHLEKNENPHEVVLIHRRNRKPEYAENGDVSDESPERVKQLFWNLPVGFGINDDLHLFDDTIGCVYVLVKFFSEKYWPLSKHYERYRDALYPPVISVQRINIPYERYFRCYQNVTLERPQFRWNEWIQSHYPASRCDTVDRYASNWNGVQERLSNDPQINEAALYDKIAWPIMIISLVVVGGVMLVMLFFTLRNYWLRNFDEKWYGVPGLFRQGKHHKQSESTVDLLSAAEAMRLLKEQQQKLAQVSSSSKTRTTTTTTTKKSPKSKSPRNKRRHRNRKHHRSSIDSKNLKSESSLSPPSPKSSVSTTRRRYESENRLDRTLSLESRNETQKNDKKNNRNNRDNNNNEMSGKSNRSSSSGSSSGNPQSTHANTI